MTSEKNTALLTKESKLEPAGKSPKKLLGIILLLVLIVIAYFVWPRPNSISDTPKPIKETATTSEQIQADSMTANANPTNLQMSNSEKISDSETILTAPLPETDSLVKEEVDRLEDEHQRLAEQEKMATEQIQMNKELTDMKAEQIKLLEQQIVQLEAAQPTQ